MNQPVPDNVILGLLAGQPCHGYQLLEFFHDPNGLGRVRVMGTSQLHVVLKRLERQGFINGQEVQSPDAPARMEYHQTEAGRDSLRIWLNDQQPSASIRRVCVEFLSRLYITRLLGTPTDAIIQRQQVACELQRKIFSRSERKPNLVFVFSHWNLCWSNWTPFCSGLTAASKLSIKPSRG
jgi:DNA-binding PadR family transcriptional regulator